MEICGLQDSILYPPFFAASHHLIVRLVRRRQAARLVDLFTQQSGEAFPQNAGLEVSDSELKTACCCNSKTCEVLCAPALVP